jgi:cytochrome b involved in lipid metabolism
MNYYTIEEVAQHNTEYDCWIVAHFTVYDLTNYIRSHPGGAYALLVNAGTDQTESYNYHSKKGKKRWNHYKIGYIRLEGNCYTISLSSRSWQHFFLCSLITATIFYIII